MSNYVHTGYWIVIMILIVVALSIGVSLDSERSKRIELEVENQKWSACFDSLISSLTENIAISLNSLDSLLAVPPKDTLSDREFIGVQDSSEVTETYDTCVTLTDAEAVADYVWRRGCHKIGGVLNVSPSDSVWCFQCTRPTRE